MFTETLHAKSVVSAMVIATLLFGMMASTTHAQTTGTASTSTISALQVQLQSLKDIIAKMMGTATVGDNSTVASNNVQVGDRVQATAPLNVRSTPVFNGVKLGKAAVGAMGTVLAGPSKMINGQIVTGTTTDGGSFWQVKYDTGLTGWSSVLYLRDVSSNYGATTGDAVTCDSFTFTPSSIQYGQPATATWHTTNASTIVINDWLGKPVKSFTTEQSYTFTPNQGAGIYPYTLHAFGKNNTQATCKATLIANTVVTGVSTSSASVSADLAVCNSMTFTPSNVKKGATATLSWNVTNASKVYLYTNLDSSEVTKGPIDSLTVTAVKPVTYSLFVDAVSGVKRPLCTAKLVVQDVVSTATTPICNSFYFTPSGVNAGSATTLKWDTTNAARVTIDSNTGYTNTATNLPVDGSLSITPKMTGEYYLTVFGTDGARVTCAAPVQVTQPAAPAAKCNYFTFTPSTVKAGQPVLMSWSTSNGVRAISTSSVPALNNYDFPLSGTYTAHPVQTTTNSITVFGAGSPLTLSNQDTCYATLTVTK